MDVLIQLTYLAVNLFLGWLLGDVGRKSQAVSWKHGINQLDTSVLVQTAAGKQQLT